MGVTTKEVADSSVEYYRQGLTQQETMERMKATITYAKISGLTMQESTEIITAAANGTGESVNKIIDVFSNLGDQTASGADEIGRAMQKTAASAKTAGVPFENLAAYIATVSSTTRESAETIGNSFKSLMARYTSIKETGFNEEDTTKINDVTRALASVGIEAVDTMGNLKDFNVILEELGPRWDSLSKKEQQYLATTMGGKHICHRYMVTYN